MANNGDNKFPVDCPHCGQRFSVTVPKAEILNTPKVSMAVTTHEKPIKCICGGSMVLVIQTIQTAWGIVPLTTEQAARLDDSKIIVPPAPGMRLVH